MKRLSQKELQATLAATVQRLVENLNVEKIVLFGSYVKGVPSKDSDLDLLVLLNTKKKGIERYAMVSKLLEPRKIPMDIIVRTPAEIKKREGYFDPFIKSVLTEGKVLYEKTA
jgi:predicted nucleotidyltransferase